MILTLSNCAHKNRMLYNPEPISVHQSSNVRNSIRNALKRYEWIVESDKPGMMVAKQMRRSHMAKVKITYNSKKVNVEYVNSDNLNYSVDEEGNKRIHGTYNTWVTNLERAIASEVS